MAIKNIPVGTFVYNVETQAGGGARLGRGAGTHVEVVANDQGYTHLKMPSGEVRKVPEHVWASVGEVSNDEHKLKNLGKAGRNRWRGVGPTVRGSAMNPLTIRTEEVRDGRESDFGALKYVWKPWLGIKTRKTQNTPLHLLSRAGKLLAKAALDKAVVLVYTIYIMRFEEISKKEMGPGQILHEPKLIYRRTLMSLRRGLTGWILPVMQKKEIAEIVSRKEKFRGGLKESRAP